VLFTLWLLFLKVFMLSPLKGGSGLTAKSTHPDLSGQSLGAFGHKPTTHPKTAITVFGGYCLMKAYRI
jgi:hypothetical protein